MATLRANGKCLAEFVVRRTPKSNSQDPFDDVKEQIVNYRYMSSGRILVKYKYKHGNARRDYDIPYKVYGKVPKATPASRVIEILRRVTQGKTTNHPEYKYEIIKGGRNTMTIQEYIKERMKELEDNTINTTAIDGYMFVSDNERRQYMEGQIDALGSIMQRIESGAIVSANPEWHYDLDGDEK